MLPNSLTFEFEVRRQVAIFSPPLLPNLLTYRLLPVVLSVRCNTVSGHDEPPWKSSPYLGCVLDTTIAHLLESLTLCERSPGTPHRGASLHASTVQIGTWDRSPLADRAIPPGTSHLSST
jgi:hypothetical protein